MNNIYMTDYGPVQVSPSEAQTLSTAVMVKTHYSGRLFGKSDSAKFVLRKAAEIQRACERFAKWRIEASQGER